MSGNGFSPIPEDKMLAYIYDDVDDSDIFALESLNNSFTETDAKGEQNKEPSTEVSQENENLKEMVRQLQIEKEILELRISEVYNTAKAELARKDRRLQELNEEKNNIVFRRMNRNFKNKQLHNVTDVDNLPTEKELTNEEFQRFDSGYKIPKRPNEIEEIPNQEVKLHYNRIENSNKNNHNSSDFKNLQSDRFDKHSSKYNKSNKCTDQNRHDRQETETEPKIKNESSKHDSTTYDNYKHQKSNEKVLKSSPLKDRIRTLQNEHCTRSRNRSEGKPSRLPRSPESPPRVNPQRDTRRKSRSLSNEKQSTICNKRKDSDSDKQKVEVSDQKMEKEITTKRPFRSEDKSSKSMSEDENLKVKQNSIQYDKDKQKKPPRTPPGSPPRVLEQDSRRRSRSLSRERDHSNFTKSRGKDGSEFSKNNSKHTSKEDKKDLDKGRQKRQPRTPSGSPPRENFQQGAKTRSRSLPKERDNKSLVTRRDRFRLQQENTQHRGKDSGKENYTFSKREEKRSFKHSTGSRDKHVCKKENVPSDTNDSSWKHKERVQRHNNTSRTRSFNIRNKNYGHSRSCSRERDKKDHMHKGSRDTKKSVGDKKTGGNDRRHSRRSRSQSLERKNSGHNIRSRSRSKERHLRKSSERLKNDHKDKRKEKDMPRDRSVQDRDRYGNVVYRRYRDWKNRNKDTCGNINNRLNGHNNYSREEISKLRHKILRFSIERDAKALSDMRNTKKNKAMPLKDNETDQSDLDDLKLHLSGASDELSSIEDTKERKDELEDEFELVKDLGLNVLGLSDDELERLLEGRIRELNKTTLLSTREMSEHDSDSLTEIDEGQLTEEENDKLFVESHEVEKQMDCLNTLPELRTVSKEHNQKLTTGNKELKDEEVDSKKHFKNNQMAFSEDYTAQQAQLKTIVDIRQHKHTSKEERKKNTRTNRHSASELEHNIKPGPYGSLIEEIQKINSQELNLRLSTKKEETRNTDLEAHSASVILDPRESPISKEFDDLAKSKTKSKIDLDAYKKRKNVVLDATHACAEKTEDQNNTQTTKKADISPKLTNKDTDNCLKEISPVSSKQKVLKVTKIDPEGSNVPNQNDKQLLQENNKMVIKSPNHSLNPLVVTKTEHITTEETLTYCTKDHIKEAVVLCEGSMEELDVPCKDTNKLIKEDIQRAPKSNLDEQISNLFGYSPVVTDDEGTAEKENHDDHTKLVSPENNLETNNTLLDRSSFIHDFSLSEDEDDLQHHNLPLNVTIKDSAHCIKESKINILDITIVSPSGLVTPTQNSRFRKSPIESEEMPLENSVGLQETSECIQQIEEAIHTSVNMRHSVHISPTKHKTIQILDTEELQKCLEDDEYEFKIQDKKSSDKKLGQNVSAKGAKKTKEKAKKKKRISKVKPDKEQKINKENCASQEVIPLKPHAEMMLELFGSPGSPSPSKLPSSISSRTSKPDVQQVENVKRNLMAEPASASIKTQNQQQGKIKKKTLRRVRSQSADETLFREVLRKEEELEGIEEQHQSKCFSSRDVPNCQFFFNSPTYIPHTFLSPYQYIREKNEEHKKKLEIEKKENQMKTVQKIQEQPRKKKSKTEKPKHTNEKVVSEATKKPTKKKTSGQVIDTGMKKRSKTSSFKIKIIGNQSKRRKESCEANQSKKTKLYRKVLSSDHNSSSSECLDGELKPRSLKEEEETSDAIKILLEKEMIKINISKPEKKSKRKKSVEIKSSEEHPKENPTETEPVLRKSSRVRKLVAQYSETLVDAKPTQNKSPRRITPLKVGEVGEGTNDIYNHYQAPQSPVSSKRKLNDSSEDNRPEKFQKVDNAEASYKFKESPLPHMEEMLKNFEQKTMEIQDSSVNSVPAFNRQDHSLNDIPEINLDTQDVAMLGTLEQGILDNMSEYLCDKSLPLIGSGKDVKTKRGGNVASRERSPRPRNIEEGESHLNFSNYLNNDTNTSTPIKKSKTMMTTDTNQFSILAHSQPAAVSSSVNSKKTYLNTPLKRDRRKKVVITMIDVT